MSLRLRLLGGFRLLENDRPVAAFEQPRLQHLLAYLVLRRGAPRSRQQVAFTFWPETTDRQALKNFRTLLTRLRQALPAVDGMIQVTPQTVEWRPNASLWVDVVEFENCLAAAAQHPSADAGALAAAVAVYGGDLLPDCYDDWVLPLREELRKSYGEALERLTLLLEERREYGAALQAARRLLQHDPLHEAAYHHLMRLHLALGDRIEALRAYRVCEAMLAQEFGARPGRPAQELYERLLAAQEIPPAQVAGEGSRRAEARLPLVGRGPEWSRLLDAWRVAAAGRSQLVLISGEAGIGKTRLSEELRAWVAGQGGAVAQAACYPQGGRATAAYAPVAEWLRNDALRPQVRALDDARLAEVARIVPSLEAERESLAARPAEALSTGHLTDGWQRTRLFEALARAALGADPDRKPRPLLLALDDLQWCDQETLDWLAYLLRYAPRAPLLVVATVRRDEIDTRHPLMAFWLTLVRAGLLEEIALSPLDAEDTARLAGSVAGKALDESEAARIYQYTEGNPLFVVETVRAGLRGDAPWPLTGDVGRASADIPARVRAVIRWRLAQLSPSAQALAQVAAAIGRRFSMDVLARATGEDEAVLLDTLDELWRRQLIRLEEGATGVGLADDVVYDFTHDGVRAVAYDEIGPIRRGAIHLRIARALDALGGDAGRLAHHYEQAGQAQLAIAHYRRAAEDSQRIHAGAAAAQYYRRLVEGGLSAAVPPQERCEVLLGLSEVWRSMGEWPRMEAVSRDALALAEALGKPAEAARAQTALADALQQLGYYDEAARLKRT
jgi:DNA-binding SARP family transcriptional activator